MSQTVPIDTTSIEVVLIEIISTELLEIEDGFDAQTNLFEHGLDSMAIMHLLLHIEEATGVSVPLGEISKDNFETVQALARVVESQR